MYFSVFVGADAGVELWRTALAQHANWLGQRIHVEPLRFGNGTNVCFGRLESLSVNKNPNGTHRLSYPTSAFGKITSGIQNASNDNLTRVLGNGNCDAVTVDISLQSGEVTFVVPPATPQHFYFAKMQDGFVFGDDLRLFRYLVNTQLDARAIYALFQYGAVPPKLTPYKNVQRIPGGHAFKLRSNARDPVCTPFFSVKDIEEENDPLVAEERIEQTLDHILASVPEGAVMYFSGGVDSGLLAARLARLERTDVQLINYAFDQSDDESQLAQLMASSFGMKCHRIEQQPGEVREVLQRISEDYSLPFGDCSTVPTNILAHKSLRWARHSLVVIEGTGADGAFGVGDKYNAWARIFGIPSFLRKPASSFYSQFELWKGDTRMEHFCRAVRKSLDMPLGPAVVAENALAGIAYVVPAEIRAELHEAISSSFDILSAGVDPKERLSQLDLGWVCAGRMAPKSFEPLRRHGIQAIYPFLQLPMLRVGSSIPWSVKCPAGDSKGILKKLLARQVPREWVYRRKSGFAPPHRELMGSTPLQEFVRETVLSRTNPLMDFFQRDKVTQIIERAHKHEKLCPGAYEFLWTLSFASGWFAQLPQTNPAADRFSRDSWVRTAAKEESLALVGAIGN